jgi:ferritin-like metal-binding protein YciE
METNSHKNSMLQDFFTTCLQELYWSETHLINILDTMSKAATSMHLQEAFMQHRDETMRHKERLEQVFSKMGIEPQAVPCMGLQGLFDEGWQVIDETEPGTNQRDVALIIAAQKVEHYEIATYGSLITLAKAMGQKEIAEILVPTLQEEKDTDITLTAIAESGINAEATQEKVNV